MKKGDLRIYWYPQVPCKPFHASVKTPQEAAKLLEVLGNYDQFLLMNRHRCDYANAGGLQEFDGTEWLDWEDAETGQNIDEWWNDVLSSESDRVNAR